MPASGRRILSVHVKCSVSRMSCSLPHPTGVCTILLPPARQPDRCMTPLSADLQNATYQADFASCEPSEIFGTRNIQGSYGCPHESKGCNLHTQYSPAHTQSIPKAEYSSHVPSTSACSHSFEDRSRLGFELSPKWQWMCAQFSRTL